MGKRKIGEIYNKPIIEGDINLKTPYEIHKSELAPQSGSGGGEGGGGSTGGAGIEYLDVRGMELDLSNNALGYVLLYSSYFANCYTSSYGMQMCSPVSDILKLSLSNVTLYGLAISLNARTLMISGGEIMQDMTIKEVLIKKGWTEEELAAIPRITEEEFYNLNA